MIKYFNQLVRDNTEKQLKIKEPTTDIVIDKYNDDEEYFEALQNCFIESIKKLASFIDDKLPMTDVTFELANLIDTTYWIGNYLNINEEQINKKRCDIINENGGFFDRIKLISLDKK